MPGLLLLTGMLLVCMHRGALVCVFVPGYGSGGIWARVLASEGKQRLLAA